MKKEHSSAFASTTLNAVDSSQHHLDVNLEKVTWYTRHILPIDALNFLGLRVGLRYRGGWMVEWTYVRLFNYTASEVLWFSLGSITWCNIHRLDAVKTAIGYLLSNQMNCVSHSKNVKDWSIQAEIWTRYLANTHSPCFRIFTLMPLANIHDFLIYALSFLV